MTQKNNIFFVCLLAALVYAFLIFFKYYALGYYDWDLAFYSQAAWKLVRADQFVPLHKVNFFGNHFCPITFFLLPMFFFFQSPLTLLSLKILAFVLSGFLLAEYVKRFWDEKKAVPVLLLYFFFPANLFGMLYEYSPEAFAPPLLFLMFISLKEKKTTALIVCALLLMAIKENMCLVAAMFSLAGAIQARDKKDRIRLFSFAFACLAFLLLCVMVIIPFFQGLDRYPFVTRYPELGSNALEILLSPVLRSQAFFSKIFATWNATFLLQMFDVLLIPALLSPGALLLAAPLFIQHFLSSHPPEHTIFFLYGPTLAPFIFIAFVETMNKLSQKINNEKMMKGVLIVFLFLLGASLVGYKKAFLHRWNVSRYAKASTVWAMINTIPPGASAVASFRFLAPLSTRPELYSFHMLYDEAYQNTAYLKHSELYARDVFRLPDTVQYAVIDLNDRWMNAALKTGNPAVSERIQRFLTQESWRIEQRNEDTLLLKREAGF